MSYKSKKRKTAIVIIILIISVLIAFTLCIFLFISYIKEKNKTVKALNKIEFLEEKNEKLYTQKQVDELLEESQNELYTKEQVNEILEKIQNDLDNEEQITSQNKLFTQEELEEYLEEKKIKIFDKLKFMAENGDGMLDVLQEFYPEYVIVSSDGSYHFFPIQEDLKKNELNLEEFEYPVYDEEAKVWEGTATYMEGMEKEAKKGIDVSTFQGDIDWDKVKKSGMEFAIIRLGFRGYESGKIVLDSKFQKNIEGSIEACLDTGVYFFTEALDETEAVEEADFVIENLKNYNINMPVVLDVEESANKEETRTRNLTAEQRTKNVIAFCERIKDAGYDVMIYGNLKSFMIMLNFEELEIYDKWFAYYRYPFHFPYKVKMWQYTSSEEVDGIKGKTDVNLMFY